MSQRMPGLPCARRRASASHRRRVTSTRRMGVSLALSRCQRSRSSLRSRSFIGSRHDRPAQRDPCAVLDLRVAHLGAEPLARRLGRALSLRAVLDVAGRGAPPARAPDVLAGERDGDGGHRSMLRVSAGFFPDAASARPRPADGASPESVHPRRWVAFVLSVAESLLANAPPDDLLGRLAHRMLRGGRRRTFSRVFSRARCFGVSSSNKGGIVSPGMFSTMPRISSDITTSMGRRGSRMVIS